MIEVEKMIALIFFSTFFIKKCLRTCVCAKKVVPLSRNCAFRAYGGRECTKKLLKNIKINIIN